MPGLTQHVLDSFGNGWLGEVLKVKNDEHVLRCSLPCNIIRTALEALEKDAGTTAETCSAVCIPG